MRPGFCHSVRRSLQEGFARAPRRSFASKPSPDAAAPNSSLDRLQARLPRFLQRYTTPLRNAPVTHVTAFLVLHELTAIVPLFGLVAVFHYTDWMPPFISEGKWVADGVQKFGNYFKRKGWLGEEDKSVVRWWDRGEGSVKIVVEFATAYAVTKALLPLRLLLSVWGTPWFARITVVPVLSIVKRLFRRAPKAGVTTVSGAAGTGATAAGVGPTSATMQPKK